jgi:hypothetical protein
VCGSIIAGVAIIPAQAAKLVEALLEWQTQQDRYEVEAAKVDSSRTKSGGAVGTTKLQKRTRMTSRPYSGRADGRGPSGVNIEIPPIEPNEQLDQPKLSLSSPPDVSGKASKTCWSCGEPSHRTDARFCWSCGKELS